MPKKKRRPLPTVFDKDDDDCFSEEDEEKEQTKLQPPYLHVHGQKQRHEDVVIVGNHEALIQLHRAITNAITKGEWHTPSLFCSDGEGYKIFIKDLGISQLENVEPPYHENF